MSAATYGVLIERYSTFTLAFTRKDSDGALINLTGYTAKLEIRATPGSTVLMTLTSASGITLGGALGTVTCTITDENTATLEAGVYAYDLVLTTGAGVATRLLEGVATVADGITQP